MKFRIPLTLRNALEREYPELNWNTDQGRFYGFAKWLSKATTEELKLQGLVFESRFGHYELALTLLRSLPKAEMKEVFIAEIETRCFQLAVCLYEGTSEDLVVQGLVFENQLERYQSALVLLRMLPETKDKKVLDKEALFEKVVQKCSAVAAEQRHAGVLPVKYSGRESNIIQSGLPSEQFVKACQHALEVHFENQLLDKNMVLDNFFGIARYLGVEDLANIFELSHFWKRLNSPSMAAQILKERWSSNSHGKEFRKYLLAKESAQLSANFWYKISVFYLRPRFIDQTRLPPNRNFLKDSTIVALMKHLVFLEIHAANSLAVLKDRVLPSHLSKLLQDNYSFSGNIQEWPENLRQLIASVERAPAGLKLSDVDREDGKFDFYDITTRNPRNYFELANWLERTAALEELLPFLLFMSGEDKSIEALLSSPLRDHFSQLSFKLLIFCEPLLLIALVQRVSGNASCFFSQQGLSVFTDEDWQGFFRCNFDDVINLIEQNNDYFLQRFNEELLLKFIEGLGSNAFAKRRLVAAILSSEFCGKISDENLVKLLKIFPRNGVSFKPLSFFHNPIFAARMTKALWVEVAGEEGFSLNEMRNIEPNCFPGLIACSFVQQELSLANVMWLKEDVRFQQNEVLAQLYTRKKSEFEQQQLEEVRRSVSARFPEVMTRISELPENYQKIRLHAQRLQNDQEALTEASLRQLELELNFLNWNMSKVEEQQRVVEEMLQRLKIHGEKFFEITETYEEGGEQKTKPEFLARIKGEAVLELHKRLTNATRAHYSDPSSEGFRSQSIQQLWIKETELALGECGTFLKMHRNGLLEVVQTLLINAVSVLLMGIPWLVNKAVTGNFFMRVQSQTEKQLTSMNKQLQASLDEQRELVEAYKKLGEIEESRGERNYVPISELRQLHERVDYLEKKRGELHAQPNKEQVLESKLEAIELLNAQTLHGYQSGKRGYQEKKSLPRALRW